MFYNLSFGTSEGPVEIKQLNDDQLRKLVSLLFWEQGPNSVMIEVADD